MRLFAALILGTVVACGDGGTEPAMTVASLAGTWTLQTINGGPLPATVSGSGANRIDVTSGSFTLTSAGGYSETINLANFASGQSTPTTFTDAGTIALSDSTITFTSSGNNGSIQTTSLSAGAFSFVSQGSTFVFVKQ